MRTLLPFLCGLALLADPARGVLLAQDSPKPAGGSGHADAGIALRVGTPGFGLEVSKLLTGHFAVRVAGNYFKLSQSKTQTDISYDASIKLQGFSALLDLFPGNRGSFHFTGGIMTDPAKVDATGVPAPNGTFTINGVTYTSAEVGILTGEVKFPSAGPYVGIGWGTPARNGGALKFLFDLGVFIGGAKVTLNATNPGNIPGLDSDVQAQQDKTQSDLDKYAKVYPVLSFGLAYRF